MHAINIHASHMPSMNSRYHHITLQVLLYLLAHRVYKDHMSVINITSYNGSKLRLSTDKFNKWLREALFNKHALPRGTRLMSRTILPRSTPSFTKVTPSGSGSHLKHRISKHKYKVVLSKTYIRTTLLMLKYQGKGRWGFNMQKCQL